MNLSFSCAASRVAAVAKVQCRLSKEQARNADGRSDQNDPLLSVAGCDEAKEEVAELVSICASRAASRNSAVSIPKGVLMIGPSGYR